MRLGFIVVVSCIGGVWVGRPHISFHITASSEEALDLFTHVSIIIQPPSSSFLSLQDPPFRFHHSPFIHTHLHPRPSPQQNPPQNPTNPPPSLTKPLHTIDTIRALNLTPPHPPFKLPYQITEAISPRTGTSARERSCTAHAGCC